MFMKMIDMALVLFAAGFIMGLGIYFAIGFVDKCRELFSTLVWLWKHGNKGGRG